MARPPAVPVAVRKVTPRLTLGGLAGFGGIVTFAIHGRYFAAHGAQVSGQLAAVVDGVTSG